MVAAGVPFDGITSTNVALTFVSLLAYTLMAIACGFLLGSVGFSEIARNAFANVFGLLCMFTSGMAFPIDMMPEPMIMIGKLLPGWWLCVSIDNVFGLGTAAATGVDYGSWASSVGLVALFAVAFICLGLALGHIRRTRPSLASPPPRSWPSKSQVFVPSAESRWNGTSAFAVGSQSNRDRTKSD